MVTHFYHKITYFDFFVSSDLSQESTTVCMPGLADAKSRSSMSELALYTALNNKGVASIWRALSPAHNTRLKTEIKRLYTMKVTYFF